MVNEKFNARWIDRGGPVSWASGPPDLTPLDFFCGDTLKEKYAKKGQQYCIFKGKN